MNIRTQWSNWDANSATELATSGKVCTLDGDYLYMADMWERAFFTTEKMGQVPCCFYSKFCDGCYEMDDSIWDAYFGTNGPLRYHCKKKRENEHKNTVV